MTITADDLAAHTADLVPPLRGRYRDLDVSVSPPGSQGFVLLEALAVLERLGIDPDPTGPDAVDVARLLIAAASDRDRHLADPAAMTTHVSAFLDEGHVAALCDVVRGSIDGHPFVPVREARFEGDTIALVAADADGWGVALIQSLFSGFGVGHLEPSTGSFPTIAAPASRSSPATPTNSVPASGRRTP